MNLYFWCFIPNFQRHIMHSFSWPQKNPWIHKKAHRPKNWTALISILEGLPLIFGWINGAPITVPKDIIYQRSLVIIHPFWGPKNSVTPICWMEKWDSLWDQANRLHLVIARPSCPWKSGVWWSFCFFMEPLETSTSNHCDNINIFALFSDVWRCPKKRRYPQINPNDLSIDGVSIINHPFWVPPWLFKPRAEKVGFCGPSSKKPGMESGIPRGKNRKVWWTVCKKTKIHNWLVVWLPCFIFPYIGNNHPNWPIFFRGVQTTNQI